MLENLEGEGRKGGEVCYLYSILKIHDCLFGDPSEYITLNGINIIIRQRME